MRKTLLILLLLLTGCTTVSGVEPINKIHDNSTNINFGTYGIVKSGNYTASLDYVENISDAQEVIDLPNTAAFLFRGGDGYIADHNFQGAEEVSKNDILTIVLPNNTEIKYSKVETIVSPDGSWYANGVDLYRYRLDLLLFQTCNNDGSVNFMFFEKLD